MCVEMESVWKAVGAFVSGKMGEGKGVSIPGLGLFTFTSVASDLGHKVKYASAPAFFLNERFARTHGVRSKKPNPTSRIPQVSLNRAAVARAAGVSREAVAAVVKDLLVAVADCIHTHQPVSLNVGVGSLVFRGGSATMKWSPALVAQVRKANARASSKSRPMTASATLASRSSHYPGASIRSSSFSRPSSAGSAHSRASSRASSRGSQRGAAAAAAGQQSVRFDGGNGGGDMFAATRPVITPVSASRAPQGGMSTVMATDPRDPGGVLLDRPPASSGGFGPASPGGTRGGGTWTKRRRTTIEDTEGDDELYDYDRTEEARRNYREALAAKRVIKEREAAMDEHIRTMLAADAQAALQKEKDDAAERRAEEQRIRDLNLAMATERKKTQELLRASERSFAEKPIFGDRPSTPPPSMRAAEYSLLLEEQINYRNARKRQAIEEEMAYSGVTQTIVDSTLDRADAEYEAELAQKKAQTAATLRMQMELARTARMEEEKANALAPAVCIIPLKPSETKAGKQAATKKLFTDQMELIAQRRAAKAAQDEADAENERRQLETLSTERFEAAQRDHARTMAQRRELEDAWKIQIDQKKALAAEEGTDIPRNTSLPLNRRPMRRSGRKNIVARRYRLQTNVSHSGF